MFLLCMYDMSYKTIFYCEHDENVYIMIQGPQDGLELRERHPGGVQQGKLMFLLCMCDTSYNPIFLWQTQWKRFHNDLMVSRPLKTSI